MSDRSSPAASRRATPAGVTAPSVPRRSGSNVGSLIAVYGARAHVGVTTIASSLALAFRALGSDDVALAELDPRTARARAASARGEEGRDAGSGSDRLPIPGVDAAMVRRPDGVWTFTTARSRSSAVSDAKTVTLALDTVRGQFAVSVAELERQVNERTLAAFDAADRILLVTEGAVPSIRGTQRVLRLCRRLNYPDEKLCVVVNRFDAPGVLPVADIAVALKREIYWRIPDDPDLTMDGLAQRLLAE